MIRNVVQCHQNLVGAFAASVIILDVLALFAHSASSTTRRYIEVYGAAMMKPGGRIDLRPCKSNGKYRESVQ